MAIIFDDDDDEVSKGQRVGRKRRISSDDSDQSAETTLAEDHGITMEHTVSRLRRISSDNSDIMVETCTTDGDQGIKMKQRISRISSDNSETIEQEMDVSSLMDMTKEENAYFDQKQTSVPYYQLINCTKCFSQLSLDNPGNIKIHPALGVLLCQTCFNYYTSGPFLRDPTDGKDFHCRWCANGGEKTDNFLICCDTCPYVFCKYCLLKCLRIEQISEIRKPGTEWSCLNCNRKPIWERRAFSRNVITELQKIDLSKLTAIMDNSMLKLASKEDAGKAQLIKIKPLVPYSDTEEESTDGTEAISIGEPSLSPDSKDFKDDVASPKALDPDDHEQEGCPSPKDFMSSTVDVSKEEVKNLPTKCGSDLETESEKEQPTKRKKGTQPNSDQDESTTASKRKRHRRTKKKTVLSYQSESDDSDVPEAASSMEPKNIRITLKEEKSAEEKKAAIQEEEARRTRATDNEAFVENSALMDARIDPLRLDIDPATSEDRVTVHQGIVKELKPHQRVGVKFMWDACFESVERCKTEPGTGCILAHSMGLGKSLQVVALAHTVLTHEICKVKRVLVLGPVSTVPNWINEFNLWMPAGATKPKVYDLTNVKVGARARALHTWKKTGGILVLSYDLYKSLYKASSKPNKSTSKKTKIPAKFRNTIKRALLSPGPDLVILDEGHLLKNEKSALSRTVNKIKTRRRIVLTGTPLQNSLDDYYNMIQFVKPYILGTKSEFRNRFVKPIENGQSADSTDHAVSLMKRRAHVLYELLKGFVHRLDVSVLAPYLPQKQEFVISVKMSDLQIQLYRHYLEKRALGGPTKDGIKAKRAGLFADFRELGNVWAHPRTLLSAHSSCQEPASQSDAEIDEGSNFSEDLSAEEATEEDEKAFEFDGQFPDQSAYETTDISDFASEEVERNIPIADSWWSSIVTDQDITKVEHSGKTVLLLEILRYCEQIQDKVLVFSHSLASLDMIEEILLQDSQTSRTWITNVDYFRLDGSTSTDLRIEGIKAINDKENKRCRLFLISTKAGGLGINLTGANRVVLFDESWNPTDDLQSIYRAYRFGQKKPVYVYRLLAQGTMEQVIYDRQITKLSLSGRVVDEYQIERHFKEGELKDLYFFEPGTHLKSPPMNAPPEDGLLADLLVNQKEWIVEYHKHDSLLLNKEDEELPEAERKTAIDEFEKEATNVKLPEKKIKCADGDPKKKKVASRATAKAKSKEKEEDERWKKNLAEAKRQCQQRKN